jgi:hypothetical protein
LKDNQTAMLEMIISLFILIAIAIIACAIEARKPDSNSKSMQRLLLYQVVAAIVSGFFFTYSSYRSGITQGQIKDTVNANSELSRQIERLQNINNKIDSSTNILVHNIDTLTNKTKTIIDRIDLRTNQQYEETALSGILKLSLGDRLKQSDWITLKFGSFTGRNTVHQLQTWKPPPSPILVQDETPIKWRIENNSLLISMTFMILTATIWLILSTTIGIETRISLVNLITIAGGLK